MWNGLFTLLSYGTVMSIASYLAGSLPLSFGLSGHHSRIISSIGSGLLVGTCLIIIIPEGISTLYSAQSSDISKRSYTNGPSGAFGGLLERRHDDDDDDGGGGHDHRDPHGWVGVSLVFGFILMYLIDEIPKYAIEAIFHRKPVQVSLAHLSSGLHHPDASARPAALSEEDGSQQPQGSQSRSTATTLGLVIHAAADGIALAASTFISESSIGVVVFAALMIHKAPAAFGLTSVLLKQGLTKKQARAHLVVFSLAAPVCALATWMLINLIAGGRIGGEENTRFATGLILLFSGGTFLYVAMHQMQEGGGGHQHAPDSLETAYSDLQAFGAQARAREEHTLDLRDVLLAVLGMLLPLLTQFAHAH